MGGYTYDRRMCRSWVVLRWLNGKKGSRISVRTQDMLVDPKLSAMGEISLIPDV